MKSKANDDTHRDRRRREDASHKRHRREQLRRGLRMTPAQRLRWLESTVEELSSWCGQARRVDPTP
jgi:hypothetical protein